MPGSKAIGRRSLALSARRGVASASYGRRCSINILLTGASGFIGSALRPALSEHRIYCLRRPTTRVSDWGSTRPVSRVDEISEPIDAVINLAGENIGARRWTTRRKQQLRESRIEFTHDLGVALGRCGQTPSVWINASAVGFYGDAGGDELGEGEPAAEDFAASLCRDWETAALEAAAAVPRRVIMRLGVVIGAGGVLDKLMLPFRFGLGAVMGGGSQHMAWVGLADVTTFVCQALEDESISGVWNLVGPQTLTQREFASALAAALHRPLLFRFPDPLLRLLMGQMADLLLFDQPVVPARLRQHEFTFRAGDIDTAIAAALAARA